MQFVKLTNRRVVIYLAIIILLVTTTSSFLLMRYNLTLGLIWAFIQFLVIGFLYYNLSRITDSVIEYLNSLGRRVDGQRSNVLSDFPVGIVLIDNNQNIEWSNKYAKDIFGRSISGKNLSKVSSDLLKLFNETKDNKTYQNFSFDGKTYSVQIKKPENSIYLIDINEFAGLKSMQSDDQVFIGLLSIDNYEDLTRSDDNVSAELTTKIYGELNEWSEKNNFILRRFNPDQFMLVGNNGQLINLEKDRFRIIDKMHEFKNENDLSAQISIGIANGTSELLELERQARNNLDLAFSRGGDQAVVRAENQDARYYGGSLSRETRPNRVRARAIARTLNSLINRADQVFIVGHNRPDLDSISSALGIWEIADNNNVDAYIVLDEKNISEKNMGVSKLLEVLASEDQKKLDKFKDNEQSNTFDNLKLSTQMIISEREAFEKITSNSLLILVDHSRLSVSDAPQLVEKPNTNIIIVDHHRKSDEDFQNRSILTYIETSASSTAELVTELIEYQNSKIKLSKTEATALLFGITLDTKNFEHNTRSRTFDAASYLRQSGIDSKLLHSFSKETLEDFQKRSHLMSLIEIDKGIAIVAAENDQVYTPINASQTADQALLLYGIEASFVIYRIDSDTVGISARSNGEVNTQIIMESLGGGGHFNVSAVQIKNKTIKQVRASLNKSLKMIEEQQEEKNK